LEGDRDAAEPEPHERGLGADPDGGRAGHGERVRELVGQRGDRGDDQDATSPVSAPFQGVYRWGMVG